MEPDKYKTVSTYTTGLAPSPDHLPPVFDHFQYVKTKGKAQKIWSRTVTSGR